MPPMKKPQVSLLFQNFVLHTMQHPKVARQQPLTVDHLKEELAIWREEIEIGRQAAWTSEELDQIEAELTALHLDDNALLSEIV